MKINSCKIVVKKIRSYQTLIIKTGRFTYPHKNYKTYKQELHDKLSKLVEIPENEPFKMNLRLNVKGAYEPEKHRVKLKSTGNTSKVFDNKEDAMEYLDEDKHFYEFVPSEIKYGSVPDVDNAMKPIIDYLEEIGIISNDRYGVSVNIEKTFGNKEESIEIELCEMEEVVGNNITFREKVK